MKTDAMEIASLKKQIIELESQVKGLTEDSSRAQAEIAGMRKRIAELEGDVKNNLAEIVELKKRIASLERELEASKDSLAALRKRVSELESCVKRCVPCILCYALCHMGSTRAITRCT